MNSSVLHKILRAVLFLLGVALIVNASVMLIVANRNLGIIMTGLLGVLFTAMGCLYNKVLIKLPLAVKCLIAAAFVFLTVGISSVYIYGSTDSVSYDEELVIVLGAGLHGDKISTTLKNRLDKALEYYDKNPQAVIAVTGGQGPDELIPESEAMYNYLVENGVPREKIIKEDRSTSTFENFEFIKEISEETVGKNPKTLYITDDFHIYRAGLIAEKAGFENCGHIHSSAPIYTAVSNGLRELSAIMYEWVFGG